MQDTITLATRSSLVDTSSYTVWHLEGAGLIAHPMGIVPGSVAQTMLDRSSDPNRLQFTPA